MATLVLGTDGKAPVLSPPGWRMWALNEIYLHGSVGDNKYVPKVGDYVKDTDNNIDYKVIARDNTTLHVTLQAMPAASEGALDHDSIISDLRGNLRTITSFVYIDRTVTPFRMDVDAGVYVYHPDAAYARIYKGASMVNASVVISKVYNAGFLSVNTNNIPLVPVAINNINNVAIRGISSCHTTETLPDRSIVTLAVYKSDDTLIYARQLFVENTAFIRDIATANKVITGISIRSPYVDNTATDTIAVPVSTQISTNNFKGVIHYQGGTELELPIDGSRFVIQNLGNASSMVMQNQTVPIFLKYVMQPNEQAVGVTSYDNKTILRQYTAVAKPLDKNYSTKLYVFPEWNGSSYTLRWFLYSLSRAWRFDVASNKISFISGTAFSGTNYGIEQPMGVSTNINEINSVLNAFTLTQTPSVVLYGSAVDPAVTVPWSVRQTSSPSDEYYASKFATIVNSTTINIAGGYTSLTDWFNALYYSSKPQIYTAAESTPPVPNKVRVVVGSLSVDIGAVDFQNNITFATGIAAGKNVYLQFIKTVGGVDQHLSVNAMVLKPA